MEHLENTLYLVLAAAFIGGMIWWGRKSSDKQPNDRTSSSDGWIGGDGDGDGD